MTRSIELSSLDLRYEGHRMKSPAQEARLLVSIQERGIEKPLEGVDVEEERLLLNGFKRYRCAKRLGLGVVPYVSLGGDEATGILEVLRASSEKSLSILEQAEFIDDLIHHHRMDVAEIADTLSRSKSWVSMRLGLVREMDGGVREKVLGGRFPMYAYMYTLRPLVRNESVRKADVEAFVSAVSGKKLSIREINELAHGYFHGAAWFRSEIDSGHLTMALERLRDVPAVLEGCSTFEGDLLKSLDGLSKSMGRVIAKSQHPTLGSRTFRVQASLLLAGILSRMGALHKAMKELHDRTREARGDLPPASGRHGCPGDLPAASPEPQQHSPHHPKRRGDGAGVTPGQDPDRRGTPEASPRRV